MNTDDKISFCCPACGARFRGKPVLADKERPCPTCTRVVRLVAADAEARDEPVLVPLTTEPAPAAATAPRAEGPTERRSRASRGPAAALCPKCGQPVTPQAVVCIECGHNLKLGLNVKTVASAKKAGSIGVAVGVGAAAAVVAGLVWAAIAYYANAEIGYVAWGVGLLTGFAVTATTRERSLRVGLAAAGLALCGLLLGKVLTVEWTLKGMAQKEIPDDADSLRAAYVSELVDQGAIDPRILAWQGQAGEDDTPPPEVAKAMEELEKKIHEDMKHLTPADRQRLKARVADWILGEISYVERVRMTLSPWDLLWFGLALSSAFKMGAGTGRD